MPEPKKETPKSIGFSDITSKSIDAMVKAGRIYPKLPMVMDRIYKNAKVLTVPRAFDSKAFGIAHAIDIDYNDFIYNLVMAKSFRQQLIAEMIREGLTKANDEPDFKKLIGRSLTFQKALGNTKTMENVPLYSVLIEPLEE